MWEYVVQFFLVVLVYVCAIAGVASGYWSFESFSDYERKKGIVLLAICLICLYSATSIMKMNDAIEVGSPIVEETRYDILGGTDTTRVSGSVSGGLFHITGSVSEDCFYKIFYPSVNSNGEDIAVPLTVKENQTEIVFLPDNAQNEYLLKLTTKQLYERRNTNIYGDEQWYNTISVKYKLYVKKETFNNKIIIDGN
ncbi:MAG: hypothetical protein J6B87_02075 [Clostridia bacterium]|nr:hypothetical protein [Clostridia bacterium]